MTLAMRETFEEWLFRVLARMMIIGGLIFIVVVWCIMQIGNRQIANLEEEYEVTDEILMQWERIPVKQQIAKYIHELPMPKWMPEVEEEAITQHNQEVVTLEETEVTTQAVVLDESDEMLLAQIMHLEEGVTRVYVSPEEAKMAHLLCGSVILHRRDMHYLGAKSIKDVIYAPGQYSSVSKLYTEPIPEETLKWARELLENGPIGPSDMIFQSQFEQGEGTYAHIYNQYFCCLTNPNQEETTENAEVTETEEIVALQEDGQE